MKTVIVLKIFVISLTNFCLTGTVFIDMMILDGGNEYVRKSCKYER